MVTGVQIRGVRVAGGATGRADALLGGRARRRPHRLSLFIALLLVGGVATVARAANVVIPAGVTGTMTIEFSYTEADFVNAFGLVRRSGGSPVYTELLNTSTTRIGRRVLQTQVTAGQNIEFYLEANKAGLPGFTHAFYSSNPAFNAPSTRPCRNM